MRRMVTVLERVSERWHHGVMSGGQYNGDEALSIAQRLGWDRRPSPVVRHDPPVHCWVVDAPELPPGRRPGLLLAWDRTSSGWRGQVVIATDGTAGQLVMVLWVAAQNLCPIG